MVLRERGRQGVRLEGSPEEIAHQLAAKIRQLGFI